MTNIVCIIVGIILGGMVVYWKYSTKPISGILHIETADPDGPYLFLELSEKVSSIIVKREIVLGVDTKTYTSRN